MEKDKCPKCGSEDIGNSPTGFWCNNKKCRYQTPCPCWQGREKECPHQLLINI